MLIYPHRCPHKEDKTITAKSFIQTMSTNNLFEIVKYLNMYIYNVSNRFKHISVQMRRKAIKLNRKR